MLFWICWIVKRQIHFSLFTFHFLVTKAIRIAPQSINIASTAFTVVDALHTQSPNRKFALLFICFVFTLHIFDTNACFTSVV